MNRFLLISGALLLSSAAFAAKVPTGLGANSEAFRYLSKSKAEQLSINDEKKSEITKQLAKKGKVKAPELSVTALPATSDFGYLDGPDGTEWYYTANPEVKEIPVEGGYEGLTETITSAYEFTIYDSNLNEVGTIKDKVKIDESAYETKAAQIVLNSVVTKKFFNNDDNYEVIVTVAMNRDLSQNIYPYVNYHSYAYTLGGEKNEEGYDEPIQEIDGYIVGYINGSVNEWSENFYISFMTEQANMDAETQAELYASMGYNIVTYAKKGYNDSIRKLQDKFISVFQLPGDQMNTPFLLTYKHDGGVYFAFSQYEKNFYSVQGTYDYETGTMQDPVQDPENNLVITLYKASTSELTETQVTKVPVVMDTTTEGALYTYYGIGNLRYTNDIDYGNYLEESAGAAFTIAKQVYTTKSDDDYVNSFYVYDANGEELLTLSENCNSWVEMSDIDGYEPQMLFIYLNDSEYTLTFEDLYTADEVFTIGQYIDGNLLTANIDRILVDGACNYAVSLSQAIEDEEGNVIHRVAWLDEKGKLKSMDYLNMGQDIQYALPYIDNATLSPYVFNTDSEREYMLLAKRTVASGGNQEELLILQPNGGKTVFELGPDAEKGDLLYITPLNLSSNPQLNVVFRDDNYKYTSVYYDLPFTKFNGGDGTAANPYLISTVGDLQQIKSDVKAYYKLDNDIDASDYTFTTIGDAFSGSLDGDGHTVSHLKVGNDGYAAGLFETINGGTVKNIDFYDVTLDLTSDLSKAAFLAADAVQATIDDVHVYNFTADNASYDSTFGTLVSSASVNTSINNSSVSNALISLPAARVGGIVGNMRTGCTITSASFSGRISGATEVGGIISSTVSGDEKITDCHVDADITAQNTVGGIIGYNKRTTINRCYVEGSIEATAPARWYDNGGCAGGIAGELEGDFGSSYGYRAPATSGVITNCLVNLSSLKTFTSTDTPDYQEQTTTTHRIVGRTIYNEEPAYGSSTLDPEGAIANNYAVASLAKVSDSIEDADTTTEGKSIDASDLNKDFFENTLGFQFGESAPWNENTTTDPALNHEVSIFFNPITLSPKEVSTFYAELVIVNRAELSADDLEGKISVESTNDEVAHYTGNFTVEGNVVSLEFECNVIGEAVITATYEGAEASCTVTSVSGVETVAAGSSFDIAYSNNTVVAQDCAIALYSTSGTLVARANSALSTANLNSGLYIAVATAANGERVVRKIFVK